MTFSNYVLWIGFLYETTLAGVSGTVICNLAARIYLKSW